MNGPCSELLFYTWLFCSSNHNKKSIQNIQNAQLFHAFIQSFVYYFGFQYSNQWNWEWPVVTHALYLWSKGLSKIKNYVSSRLRSKAHVCSHCKLTCGCRSNRLTTAFPQFRNSELWSGKQDCWWCENSCKPNALWTNEIFSMKLYNHKILL